MNSLDEIRKKARDLDLCGYEGKTLEIALSQSEEEVLNLTRALKDMRELMSAGYEALEEALGKHAIENLGGFENSIRELQRQRDDARLHIKGGSE